MAPTSNNQQRLQQLDFAFPLDLDSNILKRTRRRSVPPTPSSKNRPRREIGPRTPRTPSNPPARADDPELWKVSDELLRLDPGGAHFALSIREAFDQIYDGRRTGRWDITQLSKTEKTHIGTLVELWLQRELSLDDGERLDFSIAGTEVDCKWSRNLYDWEIPLEMHTDRDEIALVMWANEDTVRWAAGLVRISNDILRPLGRQRDRKRRLNNHGCDQILWVFRDRPMIRNVLAGHQTLALELASQRSGQKAVNMLFRRIQHELINHATIVTAAQQIDASRRARQARYDLAAEGILVLGPYTAHADVASRLGLPRPGQSQFVSGRVVQTTRDNPQPSVELDHASWRLADSNDPVVHAPRLPDVQ